MGGSKSRQFKNKPNTMETLKKSGRGLGYFGDTEDRLREFE